MTGAQLALRRYQQSTEEAGTRTSRKTSILANAQTGRGYVDDAGVTMQVARYRIVSTVSNRKITRML
jgi:hypothetical protein